jgi:hydroxyacylglutathione hydrolase
VIFEQHYLDCLSQASYLVGDERTGRAVVVDPRRDVADYLASAQEHGLTIELVIETHFHADFLSGHLELAEATGAVIGVGAAGAAEFPHRALHHGDRIELGDVVLEIRATPGHTPESISVVVWDLATDTEVPYGVLTGDTLFIGDVGRPDLLASIGVTADQLADMLYESITEKLVKLPDATLVYPAHGAGSLCGKALSNETVSTIGEQKKFNDALQPMSREEFKKIVTAEQPEAPDYFVHDAILNRKERLSLEEAMKKSLVALSLERVLELKQEGAQLLDVRDGIDYEGGHLAGTLNIALSGKYATWVGTMLSHDRPIVVIAEDAGAEEEAVMRLGRIGFDNVVGYLADGMNAVAHREELLRSTERVTVAALAELLDGKRPGEAVPKVIDIRSEAEHARGHIAGSVNIPLPHLEDRLADVPAGPVVVHCEGGYRSAIAASVLSRAGRDGVMDMVGGFKAWASSKLPVESPAASTV